MLDALLPIVRDTLQRAGLEGISAIGLLTLLAVAMYTHRAASVGGTLAGTASTIGHDLKVVSLTLAVLLVLGVIALNPARAMELINGVAHWAGQELGRVAP